MSKLIHRVTMFKLVGAEKQAKLLAAYETLAKDQKRDGKPYIAYMCAGLSNSDDAARAKGYTVVAQTKFRSLDDMKFYDEQCTAHQELKTLVKGLQPEEPPLTVYFDATPLIDLTNA